MNTLEAYKLVTSSRGVESTSSTGEESMVEGTSSKDEESMVEGTSSMGVTTRKLRCTLVLRILVFH